MTGIGEMVESFRVLSTHAALPGHFPDNPIVPGVVLLDRIAAVIERGTGLRLARIDAVKFVAPLRPDEDASLIVVRDGARVRFRVERQGEPILRGEGELA